MFNKGNIYGSLKRFKDPHYIICMEDEVEGKEFFNACIITHCSHADNTEHIMMEPNHFDPNYSIQCSPKGTYLVKVGFEKKKMEISPSIEGKLTPQGIKFVEDNMSECNYSYFPHPIWEYAKKENKQHKTKQ